MTAPQPGWPLVFALLREVDATGVSGTGVVAYGVQFSDGTAALRWAGPLASTSVWDSMDALRAVHGHHGLTKVVWLFEEETPA